ncbi:MAG: carbamoyl phosphate synthase large subunit, partial [Lachnospiraceae bacterium]|nr:carbamoyl phosphate synthase large subunit [Lachnospiraceae bacterium]
RPILIDRFLQNAMECEADAISDGTNVYVPAVMEHIELAGVHSGDSACVLPSKNISDANVALIREYTMKIAREMNVRGLMNMQYAIENDKVYVLEANPRASRTVPLVSKVCNIRMVPLATEVITAQLTGKESPIPALRPQKFNHCGVKEAVFPFNMFQEVDPLLGPEMRSTGEVLGMASDFGEAFFKAQEATQTKLPLSGTVLISVNDNDKKDLVEVAKGFYDCGFDLIATGGTCDMIVEAGIPCQKIFKLQQGRPNVLDAITNHEVSIVINTPDDKKGAMDDSYIRKGVIKARIPYVSTMAAAKASIEGIRAMKETKGSVKSLQQFHAEIEVL